MAKKRVPEPQPTKATLTDLEAVAEKVTGFLVACSEAHLSEALRFDNWVKMVSKEKAEALREDFITSMLEESIRLMVELSAGLEQLAAVKKVEAA